MTTRQINIHRWHQVTISDHFHPIHNSAGLLRPTLLLKYQNQQHYRPVRVCASIRDFLSRALVFCLNPLFSKLFQLNSMTWSIRLLGNSCIDARGMVRIVLSRVYKLNDPKGRIMYRYTSCTPPMFSGRADLYPSVGGMRSSHSCIAARWLSAANGKQLHNRDYILWWRVIADSGNFQSDTANGGIQMGANAPRKTDGE